MNIKLHIGGELPKESWKILNIQQKPHVDFIGDITDLSMFDDEMCSEIYASHVFEHIKQNQALDCLKGIYRILKKEGLLYISVPDMDILCKTFQRQDLTVEQRWHVMRMMYGGQVDDHDIHYVGWNESFLTSFLYGAGFQKISRVSSFGLFQDASDFSPYGEPISLNLIAEK